MACLCAPESLPTHSLTKRPHGPEYNPALLFNQPFYSQRPLVLRLSGTALFLFCHTPTNAQRATERTKTPGSYGCDSVFSPLVSLFSCTHRACVTGSFPCHFITMSSILNTPLHKAGAWSHTTAMYGNIKCYTWNRLVFLKEQCMDAFYNWPHKWKVLCNSFGAEQSTRKYWVIGLKRCVWLILCSFRPVDTWAKLTVLCLSSLWNCGTSSSSLAVSVNNH